MAYREAQNFFWDSASMGGATQAALSRVDVYVKKRPHHEHNRSGILHPGATVFIVPTVNTVPVLDNILNAPRARLEYTDLSATTDANTAAKFKFSPPVILPTDREYSAIFHYDGDENYTLWRDTKGEDLVNTTQISTGQHNKDVGKYYHMISAVPICPCNLTSILSSNSVTSGTISNGQVANSSYMLTNWRAISDTALKFRVFAARYAFNGDRNLQAYVNAVAYAPNTVICTTSNSNVNTTTGCVTFTIPSRRYEFIIFDGKFSNWKQVLVGERCFQKYPYHPSDSAPKLVSCVNNSSIINSTNGDINFSTLFLKGGLEKEHIVVWSRDHDGAGQHRVHVRQVVEVISNTSIRVDEDCTFTNLVCYFHQSPVAHIDKIEETWVENKKEHMMVLRDTCANATHRFTNHCFETVSITVGGNGYSNTDYITFTGYEFVSGAVVGGHPAIANLVTNSTGGVISVNFSNIGCGFVNVAAIAITVSNSTGGVSNGTNLVLGYNIGAVYYTEFLGQDGRGGKFRFCRVTDIDLDESGWVMDMDHPAGSFYTATHRLNYYRDDRPDCFHGSVVHLDGDDERDEVDIKPENIHRLRHTLKKRRCHPSWSNELYCCWGANGSISNGCGCSGNSIVVTPPGTSNCSVLVINTFANGDFSSIIIAPQSTTTTFSKYIINNDYTNEHTNSGNAMAKGIETKVTLANDHFAEDVRVYLTAYKPSNTDIKVYFRIYNSHDPEAFDDKDWTLLELKDGGDLQSSDTDENDFIELTYGFPQYPNVAYTLAGSVTTTLNSNVIVGVNTTLSSNLAVNDLVHIYQPLFPNTYQIAVVASVVNATQITLNSVVSNNDMIGSGLVIEKLAYPQQAFNNQLNDNVVRYYNTSMVEFDTFNSYQIKTVLLSSNPIRVPRVDDITMTGLSS